MSSFFVLLLLVSIVCLIVGLVKPSNMKLKSRREVSFLFGGAIVVFLILVGITGQSTSTNTPPASVPAPQVVSNTTSPSEPTTTPNTTTPPTPSKRTSAGNQNSAAANQTTPAPVSQPTPPPPPTLVVSCSPSENTLTTGQTGIWTAQVSGGVKNYSYSWSGTDGLSGGSGSATITYSTTGTKSASVNVTSGNQSVNQLCNSTITVSNPAPTPAPQTNNQNTSPASNETVSQQNAVAKAMDYLNYTAFSYEGLIAQLEYDQFSQADATYGADNSGANWDTEAAAKAKDYMSYSAFSRGSLIAQLEYDKFTQAQAEYGANSVGLTQ